MKKKTHALIILDGCGISKKNFCNAINVAKTPFINNLEKICFKSKLKCSGLEVGLPQGIMGNSEVGHTNIGAGRTIYQDFFRINNSIKNNSYYKNILSKLAINKSIFLKKAIHIICLLSDGGVHSHLNHLYATLDLLKIKNINNIYIHIILDGRDTLPGKGIQYLNKLQKYLKKFSCAFIKTICGRHYAMDRDNRWNRIKKIYNLYTQNIKNTEKNPLEGLKKAYLDGESDEFIKPISISNNSNYKSKKKINKKDTIVFLNFRADRVREITSSLCNPNFKHFNRNFLFDTSKFITMTEYDKNIKLQHIFSPLKINNSLGEMLSKNSKKQLRIAETEKYAHITYFFNGGIEKTFLNEDRCLILSPKNIKTYNKKPEMSAWLIVEKINKYINLQKYDFIVINFANMDMVGHTGFFDATIKACETVDKCLEIITKKILSKKGTVMITSDHGNAEKMIDNNGKLFTAHTNNKVPFFILNKKSQKKLVKTGSLKDIAPTILNVMKLKQPKEMTGSPLLKKNF